MRILQDEPVLNFLDKQNNKEIPKFSTKQIQGHIDFKCTCKITQDKKGNSLFPCDKHKDYFNSLRDNITLHKVIH